jgi:hypothetical protein
VSIEQGDWISYPNVDNISWSSIDPNSGMGSEALELYLEIREND